MGQRQDDQAARFVVVANRPAFDSRWWSGHVRVNERFAEVAARACAPGATVWIHDYPRGATGQPVPPLTT